MNQRVLASFGVTLLAIVALTACNTKPTRGDTPDAR